jgi:E3 ubiquitin-protein ligase TRIP12
VREGGLSALLNYLDFFSTHVQRTSLQAASNCCRNLAVENFNHVRDVFPMIRNVLGYSDQRLVEYACMCVIRIIESYYRSNTEPLETLIDVPLMRAVNNLLLPPSGTTIINSTTATSFLRALSSASRASPKITLTLLEAGVADTLYAFLTGVLPSASEVNEVQGQPAGGQGLGGGLADMAVMQNLAHRPKDQVEEALGLISELTPPLPRGKLSYLATNENVPINHLDGVFDPKGYTEKTVSRALKQKVREAKAILQAIQAATEDSPSASFIPAPTVQDAPMDTMEVTDESPILVKVEETDTPTAQSANEGESSSSSRTRKDSSQSRLSLLRKNLEVVSRFLHLIVPVLFDVYAASMTLQIRLRSLTSILKATNFVDDEDISLLFRVNSF